MTIRLRTPLPLSTDGVLPDGTVINYTPTPNSCWTQPLSRPAVNAKYDHGKCSVCVLQRRGTDLSSDYQLWARDNKNNAMGNMPATTVWPYDAKNSVTDQIQSAVLMGSSNIELNSSLSSMNPAYSQVNLMWGTQQAQYDPAPGGNGGELCSPAGTATNGAVVYFTCSFAC